MTVRQVIERTDSLFPNIFTFTAKALWLKELDDRLYKEVISAYEEPCENRSSLYAAKPDTELLADERYFSMYLRYLVMQYDITNSDIEAYNNSSMLFNNEYMSFINAYNRTHRARDISINID